MYTPLYQNRQHSDFLIHCRLFRNIIKKNPNNPNTEKPSQEQKEFRCKMVRKPEIAKYLGVRTSAIILKVSR